MGIAILTPASLTTTIFLGASAAGFVQKRWPRIGEPAMSSMAD